MRELQEKLRESEQRQSKAPPRRQSLSSRGDSEDDDDEVPYVPAGAPLDETLKHWMSSCRRGRPSNNSWRPSRTTSSSPPSRRGRAPSPASSSPGSFRDDRSWIRTDEEDNAEVVDATASPPAPPPADRSAHEGRARSHVSALVEAAEAHAHETPGKFQETQEAAADDENDEDVSDEPTVENDVGPELETPAPVGPAIVCLALRLSNINSLERLAE